MVTYFKLGRSKKTQEPLGFAFVEYEDEAITKKVLAKKHFLDQREIEVKPFGLEKEIEQQQEATLRRKVYIKGIPDGCPQSTLVSVFSQFGPVERAFSLFNHKSNTSRGFGFVEFKTEEAVTKLVGKTILIEGKEVFISRAHERNKGVDYFLLRKRGVKSLLLFLMLQKVLLLLKRSQSTNLFLINHMQIHSQLLN